jgi:hypothetical protein
MTPQQIVEELRYIAEAEVERAKELLSAQASPADIAKQHRRISAASLAYLSALAYAKLTEQD